MDQMLEYFQVVASNVWLYGGVFVLVLSLLVFVHEYGHYIVARLCGVKVESFSIGFGKELFGFTDGHGTHWRFALIPMGGYVKMFGDVDPASATHSEEVTDPEGGAVRAYTQAERDVAFFAKPVWQRSLIVAAGPGFNYLFAILILFGLYFFQGQPVTPPMVAAVQEGSAADRAGLHPQDKILSIDGREIASFEDLSREIMVGLDTPLKMLVDRQGRQLSIVAIPERKEVVDRFGFRHEMGRLGVLKPVGGLAFSLTSIDAVDGIPTENEADTTRALLVERMGQDVRITQKEGEETSTYVVRMDADFNAGLLEPESDNYGKFVLIDREGADTLIHHTLFSAFGASVSEAVDMTVSTLQAVGQMITGHRDATELGGVIRISAVAGDFAQAGWIAMISFIAILSINLGLINLFPIPVLDGGHLLLYALESIRGAPVPQYVQEYAFRLGLVFLVGIMLFANLNDLVQIAQK